MPTVTTFDALLSGYSWNGVGVAGRPVFVTYSFDAVASPAFAGVFSPAFLASFQPFNAAEQAIARAALAAWADVSGLTFIEVPAGLGDIRLGAYDFAFAPSDAEDSLGFAYTPFVLDFPNGAWEEEFGGDIFIAIGQVGFDVLAHEIGHAIGLKHPFEGDVILDPAFDDLIHTVMTYNPLGGPAAALGTFDILAVQHLYGGPLTDGTQAASWSWDAANLILTQAGSAGADTLAGVAVADRIAAGDGADYVMTRGGGDTIDGGEGADTLAGGSGPDALIGGGGNDIVDGDDGDDVLAGGLGDDDLWGMDGADTLTGDDGRDSLNGGAGANHLSGGAGDDLIVVRDGASRIDGGEGFDVVWLVPVSAAPTILSYASLTAGGGRFVGVESVGLAGDVGADTLLGGALPDLLVGDAGADSISGDDGNDEVFGGTGADTVLGGAGADTVSGGEGANYLRGDEGDDSLLGGGGFDDIHGNVGDDTASGGAGDDWVVGGKDPDRLAGDEGSDIVYGNLGADTCEGGAGDDLIRGGQQDDLISGGAGNDWLSGDRDNDTLAGGAGADVFHTFGDAGIDRVTDFSLADGDRVQLDPGTAYTVAQAGADTVISMMGGGQMTLVGVSLATLTPGWIFGA